MSSRPKFKISRLREIGWSHWDPIGLRDVEDRPNDEYDSYMLQAAGLLWNGKSNEEVVAYLADIEAEYMGLGPEIGVRERASCTAIALANYVMELRS